MWTFTSWIWRRNCHFELHVDRLFIFLILKTTNYFATNFPIWMLMKFFYFHGFAGLRWNILHTIQKAKEFLKNGSNDDNDRIELLSDSTDHEY